MSTVHAVRVVNSAELYRRCQERQQHAEQAKLWGLHVQRRAVTLFVGTTSAGKTTLLHNLAFGLASGQGVLGISPAQPLRVLYVDFESHDGVFIEHFEAIGMHPNLDYIEPEELPRGPLLIATLEDTVRRGSYDVVIVDPLMDAYPVEDENANAEAAEQMLAFRDLARSTGAGVIVVHNSGRKGEDAADDTAFLARGATARADKADVGINFVKVKSGDGVPQRALVVAKSRQANYGDRIELRFAPPLGYELLSPSTESEGAALGDLILALVRDESAQGRPEVRRETIRDRLGLSMNEKDQKALSRAFARLVTAEKLRRVREGVYALPPTAVDDGGMA
jgi:hypothetical protein